MNQVKILIAFRFLAALHYVHAQQDTLKLRKPPFPLEMDPIAPIALHAFGTLSSAMILST